MERKALKEKKKPEEKKNKTRYFSAPILNPGMTIIGRKRIREKKLRIQDFYVFVRYSASI